MNVTFLFNNNDIKADVYVSRAKHLIIKFETKLMFSDDILHYGIKMGYEKDKFFVKELEEDPSRASYRYFEFCENQTLINNRYSVENDFVYEYQNQLDNEYFLYYKTAYSGEEHTVLRWYNPKIYIRHTLDYQNKSKNIEIFNDLSNVFTYYETANNQLELRFQLLEAAGWTHAY